MNVYVMFSILTVVVLVLNCSFLFKYKNTYKQQANICKRIRDGGIDKEDITKGCAKVLSRLEEKSIAKLISGFHTAAKKHNLTLFITFLPEGIPPINSNEIIPEYPLICSLAILNPGSDGNPG